MSANQKPDYFYFKEHLFLVTELLRDNLYEFYKYNRESGDELYFTIDRLKKVTRQILVALEYIHQLGLIHCDLKPENILIKSYSRFVSFPLFFLFPFPSFLSPSLPFPSSILPLSCFSFHCPFSILSYLVISFSIRKIVSRISYPSGTNRDTADAK